MTKVKEIKTINTKKKAKITLKSLINDVRLERYKEKIETLKEWLKSREEEIDNAEILVKKLKKQRDLILELDINEIDLDDLD